MRTPVLIDGKGIATSGWFIKTAKLQDEYFVPLEDPQALIRQLVSGRVKADLFTFVQDIHDRTPKYKFKMESDSRAVLPISTYENWFKNQITFKPRNKLKKALKSGLEVRVVEFTDDLAKGIMAVYNESPLRQGKRNLHYGKDFDTIKREHQTFLHCSDFIGAFYEGKLIGFAKVTHVKDYSIMMNIVAMISHRDKAPTNALIAKAVEVCAKRNSSGLNYSIWGGQGLNEFKVANGFERQDVPRYFVPLTLKGRLALGLNLHRRLTHYLPEKIIIKAGELRTRWNEFKYRNHSSGRRANVVGEASR